MARVVGKKSGPPYLLIVFIFLFVIASAVAVMQYMDRDKLIKDREIAIAQLKVVAGDLPQTNEKFIADMRDMETRMKDPSKATCMFAEKEKQITDLANKIQIGAGYTEAIAKADEGIAKDKARSNEMRGLVAALENVYTQLDGKCKEANDLTTQLAAARAEAGENKDAVVQLNAKMSAEMTKKNQELEGVKKQRDEDLAKYRGEVQNIAAEFKKKTEEQDGAIAEKGNQLVAMAATIREKDAQINAQKEIIEKLKPKKLDFSGPKISGKILEVVDGTSLCYINLGSDNQVNPGLTFSVYGESAIADGDANNKGTIEVTVVSKNSSQCRIILQKKNNRIAAGNLIGNIAYNAQHKQLFVVEGAFDLRGDGKPTAQQAEDIKNMVVRAGGQVAKSLDYQADYLVLGEEPPRPPKPKDSADETANEIYKEQMKVYDRYQSIRKMAQEMGIPVLNANRFMSYIGQDLSRPPKADQ